MQLGRSMNDLIRGIALAPGRVALGMLALELLMAGLPPVLGAQSYDTIDPPASEDPEPSKFTGTPATPV